MVQLSLDSMEELAWLHLRGGYWSQTLRRSASSSSGCRTHPVRLGLLPSPWDDVQKSRQASRQTDRQAGRQTGRQTDRQADRQAGRQTDRQTDRQADRQGKAKQSKTEKAAYVPRLLIQQQSAPPLNPLPPLNQVPIHVVRQSPGHRNPTTMRTQSPHHHLHRHPRYLEPYSARHGHAIYSCRNTL
jgi:hypothetical protein